jgi:Transcriptional regulator
MDIRQLRYFCTVAQYENISRAARRLNVAQPAISRHIKQLEHEIGVPLLQRNARGVVLTDAGQRLLSHANYLLRHFEQVRSDVLAGATEPAGPVSAALLPTVAEIVGVPLAARIQRDFKNISLVLREGSSGSCTDWLLKGEVDFAALYNIESFRGLETVTLFREPICLVGPASMPRPEGKSFRTADVSQFPLILPSPFTRLRRLIDSSLTQCNVTVEPILTIDSLGTTKRLVERGAGLSLVPISAAAPEVREGRLWSLPLTQPDVVRIMELAYVSDRPLSNAGRLFRDAVQDEVAHLVASGEWPEEITLVTSRG